MSALKRQLRFWGWSGALAMILMLLAAAAVLLGRTWNEQRAEVQAHAAALRTRLLRAQAQEAKPQPSMTAAQWRQLLPPSGSRQDRLVDLLELGLRHGLTGARTEHRLSVDATAGLERLRVTMPVVGRYGQVREFIAEALLHDPALSLDSLKLRRASPNAPDVEAELLWSMHSRSEGVQ